MTLDFLKDNVTWVTSKLSGTAGVLGAEAIELRIWILSSGCVSEEFIIVVANLAHWMANSSPPWASYYDLMACRLVALDKRLGVCPVGILSRGLQGIRRRLRVGVSKCERVMRPA